MNIRILNNIVLAIALTAWLTPLTVQGQTDSTKKARRESIIYLRYHLKDNKLPFLKIQTKNKTEAGFETATNIPVTIFMDTDLSADALVGTATTDKTGSAILGIPASFAAQWKSQPTHTFYAHTGTSTAFDSATKEVTVTIARLTLDTASTDDTKSVMAILEKNDGASWVPMAEIDVKLAVRRYGGNVNIGDDDTYATDSTGKAEGEFALANLPGGKDGKLELVAFVDDNDEVGTLESSMVVPWGTVHEYKSDFGKRSLWSTPRRAPIWLMLMAYGCIVAVWSVIIYLITRIIKIKKLGKSGTN